MSTTIKKPFLTFFSVERSKSELKFNFSYDEDLQYNIPEIGNKNPIFLGTETATFVNTEGADKDEDLSSNIMLGTETITKANMEGEDADSDLISHILLGTETPTRDNIESQDTDDNQQILMGTQTLTDDRIEGTDSDTDRYIETMFYATMTKSSNEDDPTDTDEDLIYFN